MAKKIVKRMFPLTSHKSIEELSCGELADKTVNIIRNLDEKYYSVLRDSKADGTLHTDDIALLIRCANELSVRYLTTSI